MASLNHKSGLPESRIFLRNALDTSGKTGGGFSFGASIGKSKPAAKQPAVFRCRLLNACIEQRLC
jgi:hypothetical protein